MAYKLEELTRLIIGFAMEVHLAQALNYREAYHLGMGLLINFGARSL